LKGAASPIYYIAGPPAMVKGLREMLSKAGMKDGDIHAEEFAGY
jgi:ferredoxin-NADP reductase